MSESTESAAAPVRAWRRSRYNLLVPVCGGAGAVYNRRTGACILLEPEDFGLAEHWLQDGGALPSTRFDGATELASHLIAAGALLESGADELALVRASYANALDGPKLLLTVIPTFSCNFDCIYCAVPRREGRISSAVEAQAADFVARYLDEHPTQELRLDWFGGEPLCAPDVIDRLSRRLVRLCDGRGVAYSAQLITNGSLVDDRTIERLAAWKVNRVQVTLDGNRETHERRRPWRGGARSSFDAVVQGLERLIGHCELIVRVNIDRTNLADASSLLALFESRGWLTPDARFSAYPAVVCDFSRACRWSSKDACEASEYYAIMTGWLEGLARLGMRALMEGLYGFPQTQPTPCGAVGRHSFVITPRGLLHRCLLEAEQDACATGVVSTGESTDSQNVTFWRGYDPFADAACRDCEALPSCLGGCPFHRRNDRHDLIAQNCEYYRQLQPRLLAAHVRLHAQLTNSRSGWDE